ncbi:MAG TPA: hypothetical protein VMU19_06120 [Bryobacteraceae bacterium]|nr:hypothetical protein [Bryobacteraceae bacterium]
MKPRWWAAAVVFCLVAAGGAWWLRSRALRPAALIARLPRRDALVACVDFDALRRAGILQMIDGANAEQDPDYRSFVERTRFDYARDLDFAVASFAPGGKFLLLRGRFDWKSLQAYVRSQNGQCDDSLCRMTGSAPDRLISFFPLRSNLMALAVSQDDSAALRMAEPGPAVDGALPDAPLWISIPPSALKSAGEVPEGARPFTDAIGQADSAVLSFAPDGTRIAATLDIRCRRTGDAAEIASRLGSVTGLLKQELAKEGRQPGSANLSGILAAGAFQAQGQRVLGRWPIETAFLQSVLGKP